MSEVTLILCVILSHKPVPLQVSNVIQDSAGKYLIIQGSLLNKQETMANVFELNSDSPYFKILLHLLGKLIETLI